MTEPHIMDLGQRLEFIAERAKAAKAAYAAPEPARTAEVVQLPFWPEPVRGVPNGVLRSALFGAIRKGARRYMEQARIAALEGAEIHYTGQRLDQGDLNVWEAVLHIARLQEMGQQCRFTAYAILKLLSKTDTGKNRQTLHKRILRLRANAVEIKQGRFTYVGGLIDEAYKDDETQEYIVVLNAKLRSLFTADQFTQIDWNVRHALDGHQLAQWLHGFYASHAKPYPLNMATLLTLSGSENNEPRSSRQKLRKALDAVAKASEAHGQPFKYEIHDDLVYVERKPSRAQYRHLVKKSKAK